MDLNVARHLAAVERSVSYRERDGEAASAITLARSYATSIENLWDALTRRERLPRWFLPVSGELKLGGRFDFEGNAGGTITACEAPSRLSVTWEFGGDVSWVDVEVSPDGDGRARLALTHTALLSPFWERYGPGATGVGWECGLLGLALHFACPDAPRVDEEQFAASSDGKAFLGGSSEAWGGASIAAGTEAEAALAAARQTTAFYTGQPVPPD